MTSNGRRLCRDLFTMPPLTTTTSRRPDARPDGTPVWTNLYNGTGNDWGLCGGGGLERSRKRLCDWRFTGAGGLEDFATIKYSPEGNAIWTNRFAAREDSRNFTRGQGVDSSRNVYVTGVAELRCPECGSDFIRRRRDFARRIHAWARYFSDGFSLLEAMAVDVSGNVYVTGLTEGGGNGYAFATWRVSARWHLRVDQ